MKFLTLHRLLVLVVVTLIAAPACNQGEFSGGGTKKTTDAKSPGESDQNPKKKKKPNSNTDEDIGLEENNDDGEDGSDTNEDILNPNIGTDNSQAINNSVIDALSDLLTGNKGNLEQPNENQVTTAPGKGYRIGDGAANGTSCKVKVDPEALAGKRYYFEFEVTRDQTEVAISFGITCGIDFGDTNSIALNRGGTQVYKELLKKNIDGQGMPSQTLSIGKYTIVVESKSNSSEPNADPVDFDDFLVGELKVTANKPIKAGKIGSQ